MTSYWPVVMGVVIELAVAAYAALMLHNYRQFYLTIGRAPRQRIIIGYRFVIGLSIVLAVLFAIGLPWLLAKGE